MAEPPSTPAGTGASGRRAGWLRWRRVGWLVLGTLVLIVSTVAAVRQPPHPDALRPVPGWLDAGFWRWPVERNAFMRLPLPMTTTVRPQFLWLMRTMLTPTKISPMILHRIRRRNSIIITIAP